MVEALNRLQEELKHKSKTIELIMAIDDIRDTVSDPVAMLTSIVKLLVDQFEADFCMLALINPETGELELKAVNMRNQEVSQGAFMSSHQWAERAMSLDQVTILPEEPHLGVASHLNGSQKLQLAAVPVIMGENRRLGALLLGRSYPPFTRHDIELLEIVEDHVDSAVIQGYAYADLQERIKELEIIYRIDRIRDEHIHLDDMLNATLQALYSAMEVEMAFIMLYDNKGHKLEMCAATHDDLFDISSDYQTVERASVPVGRASVPVGASVPVERASVPVNQVANESLRAKRLICRYKLTNRLHSAMCLPLILNDKIMGVLGVINRYESGRFTNAEQRLLRAIGSQLDTAVFEDLEKRHLRQVLGRSVGAPVMKKLLANPDVDFLKGERREVSVLYCDLRGSTRLAEETEPDSLVEFLNNYFEEMTKVILAHEGTLDKFVGDQVMALFGAPFWQANHALKAVQVGLAMQATHQKTMAKWKKRGIMNAPVGIGIATGDLIAGEIGSPLRTDYTVIGRAANLGARICNAAQAGKVLISQTTYEQVWDKIEAKAIHGLHFKGVAGEVTVYEVRRILG